ncbi:MAG: hypothetical protein F6K31_29235 [Symploca sp. SIO2G7]|nr:hypothetical protein [Symploca sp. SIO2G7]
MLGVRASVHYLKLTKVTYCVCEDNTCLGRSIRTKNGKRSQYSNSRICEVNLPFPIPYSPFPKT